MRPRWVQAAAAALALFVALVAAPPRAWAHDFLPGVLSLVERDPGSFDVRWTAPVDASGAPGEVRVVYPPGCEEQGAVLSCAGALSGPIAFEGLASSRVKVVVAVRWRDGHATDGIATGASPAFVVERGAPTSALAWVQTGAEHVLLGLDHVAFVVGLFVLVGRRPRTLVATITSFTVAHSVTLALASLRLVELPSAPVEATIAASVLLVAKEGTSAEPTLARTRPWLVAFLFGLVHGLGFADALEGLPLAAGSFAVALLSFNAGVELAQLAIVAALVLAGVTARRAGLSAAWRAGATRATCYALGALGAFWLFDRAYLVLNR